VLKEFLVLYVLELEAQSGQQPPMFSQLPGGSGSPAVGNVVYDDGQICR
jgi:hypothetical protein